MPPCTLSSAFFLFSAFEQSKGDSYLRDQRLQKPLHSQSADLQTLRVPFQQDGGRSAGHDYCKDEDKEEDIIWR